MGHIVSIVRRLDHRRGFKLTPWEFLSVSSVCLWFDNSWVPAGLCNNPTLEAFAQHHVSSTESFYSQLIFGFLYPSLIATNCLIMTLSAPPPNLCGDCYGCHSEGRHHRWENEYQSTTMPWQHCY